VKESTRGDPCSPLVWTTLSVRDIAAELARQGHRCGKNVVARLLACDGFSLQGNSRTIEGRRHPDRDAQFRYIAGRAAEFLAAGDPVISVDTKKKEPVGQYGNPGRCWRPAGDPVRVRDHDFPDPGKGVAIPYGIYDVGANAGFVNAGTDHDTPAFAVESIRRWWAMTGKEHYAGARRLLITADAGGSSDHRKRAWKAELAKLAAGTGLEITCCHFPPGTSKWNKIEHRLFCHISRTWRARPLASHQVIIDTIAATTTAAGLTVTARLDIGRYPVGVQVSGEQMKDLEERVITRHDFHGGWNYTLLPVPRPAAPAPEPAPPGPDLTALAHPALTGVPSFADAVSAVTLAWQAAREQRLHLTRGGARKRGTARPALPGSAWTATSWPPATGSTSACPAASSARSSASTSPASASPPPASPRCWNSTESPSPPPRPASAASTPCSPTPQPPASSSPTRRSRTHPQAARYRPATRRKLTLLRDVSLE
jgi:Rhodopirellula transposase DDE domain